MLGNLLIVATLICYGLLANLLLKPAPGGDYGVGYSFVWLIYMAGIILSTGLLVLNMKLNQCFDWTFASYSTYRNVLIFISWIAFNIAVVWSLDYNSRWIPGEFPEFMRWLSLSKVSIWLPVLMFVPALYLLNAQREAGLAPSWVKLSMTLGFCVSLLIGLGILYGFAKASVQRRAAIYEAAKQDSGESWAYTSAMKEIENYHDKSVQGLLVYTHREKDERLRKAAVAKIKTFADWESELTQALEKGKLDEVYWVFAFLDGNAVDHPENFIQPVKNSLDRLATELGNSLKDPNSLYIGYINLEAVCRVLDTQFKGNAAQFKPGVLKLQKALEINAPARSDQSNKAWFEKALEDNRIAVSNWLGAHF